MSAVLNRAVLLLLQSERERLVSGREPTAEVDGLIAECRAQAPVPNASPDVVTLLTMSAERFLALRLRAEHGMASDLPVPFGPGDILDLIAEIGALSARLSQLGAGQEGLHRIEAVRWSRSDDEELDGNVYGEPVTLLIVKGHVGPTGWDDAVRVVRATPAPPGPTTEEET